MTRLPLPSLNGLPYRPPPMRELPATAAPLPHRHRVVGKQAMLRHQTLNGLAFPMFTGGVILALASLYNPSHTMLAMIGSMPMWAMGSQLMCGWVLRGRDVVHSAATLWMTRGLFLLPLFAAPWLAATLGNTAALSAVLIGYTGFCIMRAMGMGVMSSIVHPLGNATNFGRVQGQINRYVWLSALAATSAAFIVMRFGHLGPAGNVLLLIGVGLLLNTASSLQMRRVPLRSGISRYRASAAFVELWRLARTPRLRPTLMLGGLNVSLWVSVSMPANYGIKANGWDGSMLLIMQLAICLALFCANAVTTPLVDRLGTRRSLWVGHTVFAASMLAMAFWPAIPSWALILGIAVSHGGVWFVSIAVNRLILTDAPDGPDKIVYQSAISVAGTVVAFGFGLGLGRLCDLMELGQAVTGGLGWGHIYTPAFMAGAALVLVSQLVALRKADHE